MALSHLNLLRPVLYRFLPTVVKTPLVTSSRVPSLPHMTCPTVLPNYVRHYATKKSKAKAKGQTAKVNINAALVEDIISLEEVKEDMAAVLTTLKEEFSRSLSIRTSPGALDHITVTTKDGKFPLNQLGQISMKSPQLLVVNMTGFPEATAAVTRALQDSSMGLNPEVEGTIIRVPVPKVTREHRENLVKLAKQFSNKAKDSLRRVRTNAVTRVKKSKESVSEDTIHLVEKQIQQMADSYAADIDKQLVTKTKELLG
ncbi:ribosome-recycling factor, mitochondrial-like [Carassius auratus]|uniref:Ribosome-recycling factor, mitochondrial n=1 Tax=Carassius auratus TaxID=7957 RepID=A0A6P6KUV6_CARAU|nr:ribosome-recycling factor, mitochondrial-like [Carassius auratus]XP_026075181.1 ribosome-recycling factor, mitochondrial-like [Carassius auratus]XP_026075183.1 ribosome-recycling factor, mitochondrial-like [Carassius auratus]